MQQNALSCNTGAALWNKYELLTKSNYCLLFHQVFRDFSLFHRPEILLNVPVKHQLTPTPHNAAFCTLKIYMYSCGNHCEKSRNCL